MAFQFGTNWNELSRRTGPIQGPLLGYETFTAFILEATFFGVLMFGRSRVPRWAYLLSCLMVSLGTSLSAFWILVNNSWMQHPTGFRAAPDGVFNPEGWLQILFNSVVWVRFPHMILAAYLTTAFCVSAAGAWYLLFRRNGEEARAMLDMGLRLAAILVPAQLLMGHLVGGYVAQTQPSKIAAIEGRWHDEQPASETLFAIPDVAARQNRFAITLPAPVGSLIDSRSSTAKEIGLESIPRGDWPLVLIRSLHCRMEEPVLRSGDFHDDPGWLLDTRQGCADQFEGLALQRRGLGGEHE